MKPHPLEKRFHLESNTAHVLPADAGTGIEIDAQLVRVLEIAGTHGVWMELDAAQVHDPREPRRVIDDDFLRFAARWEGQRNGSQPRGPLGGRAFLIKRLAFGAVDEAL